MIVTVTSALLAATLCDTRPDSAQERLEMEMPVAQSGLCLWIDASAGASGDMLLGALLDAGAPLEAVSTAISALGVEPIEVLPRQVRRHGLRATKADVQVNDTAVSRTVGDVRTAVQGASGVWSLDEPLLLRGDAVRAVRGLWANARS